MIDGLLEHFWDPVDNNHDDSIDGTDIPFEPGSLAAKKAWKEIAAIAKSPDAIAQAKALGYDNATGMYKGKVLAPGAGPGEGDFDFLRDKLIYDGGHSPEVATKIAVAIQNYRRSLSGVAFSVPESKEYKDMFPNIGRTQNFNKANLDALMEVMNGDLRNFYSLSMGKNNYDDLFGGVNDTDNIKSFNTLEEAESANLPIGTKIIINGRRAVVE